jgi:hypothetical protein
MPTGLTGPLKPFNLDASKVSLRLWPVVSDVTTGQPPNGAWYEHFRGRNRTVDASGTHMFLIALGAGGLASWDGAERRKKARDANSKGCFTASFAEGTTL